MKHRFVLTAALLAVLVWLPAPGAPQGGIDDTLDQAPLRTTPDSYFYVGADGSGGQHSVAQIFTAGLYGYLRRVRLYLENDPASPLAGPVQVSVQTATDDGLPSGREIASHTMAACSDSITEDCYPAAGPAGWVDVSVSPAIVTPGTRYALVLSASGSTGHIRWYDFIGPSAYAAGFMAENGGSGWWAGTYDDMAFQTYVKTPALDQEQAEANSAVWLAPGYLAAQSFTAGVSGELHAVSVRIENDASFPATALIRVSIKQSVGGRPEGSEIGAGIIPLGAIPPAYGPNWVYVPLQGVHIAAGAQYFIVLDSHGGNFYWQTRTDNPYPGGTRWLYDSWWFWHDCNMSNFIKFTDDLTFRTWVLPPVIQMSGPPAPAITPCANGACPETKGGLTPANFTDGITSHFLFKERPNGTIQGIFDFDDALSDDPPLSGCTTESAACRLTVKTFVCSGPQEMIVAGTYRRPGDTYDHDYQLSLSGTRHGPGTFTLGLGDLTYTLSRDAIVEVSCPAGVTR